MLAHTCEFVMLKRVTRNDMTAGAPAKVGKPAVSKVTGTSVKLKWSPPEEDGGSPITTYQVLTYYCAQCSVISYPSIYCVCQQAVDFLSMVCVCLYFTRDTHWCIRVL